MGKLVAIKTYEEFGKLLLRDAIDNYALNYILDTKQLYTHGIFINGATFGTKTSDSILLTIAGSQESLALTSHTHSNYLEKDADIDIGNYKIKSGQKDLMYVSDNKLYIGGAPVYINDSTFKIVKNQTTYDILDTGNFSIEAKTLSGTTLQNVATFKYGGNNFSISYVRRINTTESFDNLVSCTLAGTTKVNNVQYGFLTLYTDNTFNNPGWAQLRFDIDNGTMQYRTSANSNNWISLNIPSLPVNALNTAGIVTAPTSSDGNKVWKTDSEGNPGWRSEQSCTFNDLKFLLIENTDLMTYNTLTTKIIRAGDNIAFSYSEGVLTLRAADTTYNLATDSTPGLVKVGTTLESDSSYTKVHIKDGFIYYHDTTYSFSDLKFLQTSGTDLFTYNSQSAKTILAGDNITFQLDSNNNLVIKSKVYSDFSGSGTNHKNGLVPDPGATQGTTKFLREDGTWEVPTYTQLPIFYNIIFNNGTDDVFTYDPDGSTSKTIVKGSNINFEVSGNTLTISAIDTWKPVNTTLSGYVPNIVTNGSLSADDNPFILVYKNVNNNTTPVWVPLPVNAFNNTTYTFYDLVFNDGTNNVDTYKPTTTPSKTIKAGSNVTISAASDVITISSKDTWTAADFDHAGYVPKSVKGMFLHANATTGALEWVEDRYSANTDKTGIKLGTVNGTKKTDSTVIKTDSSTGLLIEGGTNLFKIGDGTNYIEIGVTPSITNNVTGSGTSGKLAKWNGTNTITDGPTLSDAITSLTQSTKFLREDGTWAAPSYTTDKTGVKKGTAGSTTTADDTVISVNSSSGIIFEGGTNQFKVGNGTNSITIGVSHGLSTKNININGTDYAVYTSANSLPTIKAPTALGTSGQYLTTSDDGKSLTWRTLPTDNNTWRPIAVNGTEKRSSSISSGDLDIINGTNTTVEWTSGSKLKINAVDTWTAWKGATDSANGTAGYMPAPTSAQRGQFLRGDGSWVSLNNYSLPTASSSTLGGVKTGAAITDITGYTAVAIKDGVIYYKDTNTTYSFSNLLFLLTSGTNLMTYNSQATRTVLAGSNITFTHNNNILTIKATDTTYSAATSSVLGLIKIGTTLDDANGYTKVHIKDGFAYYHDTTYSFSKLKFLLTAGTDLMTYDSLAARTIIAGDNITFTHSNNVLTIKATDTTYPTATSSALGLVKVGDTINDTTGYTAVYINGGKIYYKDTNTTYSAATSSTLGLVKIGDTLADATGYTKVAIKDGIIYYKDTNTTYSTVSKSAAGLCPTLPNETTTTKYLRLDGTWVTPPNNNTWKPVNTSLEGYAPKLATGGGTIATQSTEYVLTFKSGTDSAPVWRLLPANAYNDHTYTVNNGTYSIKSLVGSTTTTLSDFTANQSGNDDFTLVQGSNITFTVDTTNRKLTIAGTANTWTAVSSTADGYVPKIGTAAAATIGTQSTEWVLASTSGGTPSWRALPANAFKNDNTWKAANASQEGYVPKSIASKILRSDANGALYWGDDANTTYTFYNLLFQNSGGTTVDTYKPTTSPTKTLKAGSNVTISAASNVITIASTNTWNANAVGVAGYVAAPTKAANANMTWLTDANGNPAWRASNNHSHSYLPLSGDTMVGNITFSGDNNINWTRNTDFAQISFKNTGNGDTDSYMSFVTGDDLNEYFRFSHTPSGGTNTEWMTIKSDGVRVKGTLVSLNGHKHAYTDLTGSSTTVNQVIVSNGTANGWTLKTLGNRAFDNTSYLPIAGNSTSLPMTGTIYMKDVNAIILNSNNKDLNIWEVYGNAGAWTSEYGFNLQYKGTAGANDNDLILWAHNQTSTHQEVYRVHQNGLFIFKSTPYVGSTAISLNGHTHPYLNIYSYTLSPGKGVRITHPDYVPALVSACRSNGDGQMILIGMGYNEAGWVRRRWRCILDSTYFHWSLPGEGSGLMSCIEIYHNASSGSATVCVWALGNVTFTLINALTSTKDTSHILALTSDIPTKSSWNYNDMYVASVSISGNNLRINKNGTNTDLTIPYATNADTVDGYHEYSFLRYRGVTSTNGEGSLWSQIGIKQYNNGLPDSMNKASYTYGSCISLPGANSRLDIWYNHQSSSNSSSNGGIYYRSGWNDDKKGWVKLIDSGNIGSQSVNYATSAGNAASATKLATSRTIWGQSFDGTANVSGALSSVDCIYLNNNTAIYFKNTSNADLNVLHLSSGNTLHLGYSSSANGSSTYIYGNDIRLLYGTSRTAGVILNSSGNVGIGTTNPTKKLHVNGDILCGDISGNGSTNRLAFRHLDGQKFSDNDYNLYLQYNLSSYKTFFNGSTYYILGGQYNGNAASATKLANSRNIWGLSFNGTGNISGSLSGVSSIELSGVGSSAGHGGFIDFHYNGSTADYTSRIIEWSSGVLNVSGTNLTVNGNPVFHANHVLLNNGEEIVDTRGIGIIGCHGMLPASLVSDFASGNAYYNTPTGISPYNWGQVLSFFYDTNNAHFLLYVSDISSNIDMNGRNTGMFYRSGWGSTRRPWRLILDNASILTYYGIKFNLTSTASKIQMGFPKNTSFVDVLSYQGTSAGNADLYVGNADHDTRVNGRNVYLCVDGNYVVYVKHSVKRVGINTTDPASALEVNGDCRATNFVGTSDVRLKDIISYKVPDLDTIAAAPGFLFRWKDPEKRAKIYAGTSALYWQEVFPNVVHKADNSMGTLAIQYDVLGTLCSISLAREVKMLKELVQELREYINNHLQ